MTHNHRFGSAKFSADLAWGSYPPKNGNSITLLPPELLTYLNAKVSCFRVLAIIFHLAKWYCYKRMIFCQKFGYNLNCVCVLCKYSILLDIFFFISNIFLGDSYLSTSKFWSGLPLYRKTCQLYTFSHFPLYSSYSERGDSFRARTEHVFVQRFFFSDLAEMPLGFQIWVGKKWYNIDKIMGSQMNEFS